MEVYYSVEAEPEAGSGGIDRSEGRAARGIPTGGLCRSLGHESVPEGARRMVKICNSLSKGLNRL